MTRSGRVQLWVVVVLTLLAVLRGSFWAVAAIAPSPIDEMQHFDYVRSVARGDGVPTVGTDHLGDEVLRFAKESPTFIFRSYPYPGDLSGPSWVGADPQYEGIQGPTYYGALAPFYWAGRPWGTIGSFYFVRFGSVLIGALVIPLTWLLARRLLPGRPSAWLLPPILLMALNSVNAGSAPIGNDIVVLTGTAAAAVLLLRGLERRTVASAAVAGLVAGLVLLGKTTAMALVPVLGLLALPHLLRWWRAEDRRSTYRWVGAYAVAFGVPFGLWTLWNLVTYRAISAAAEAEAITGPLQTAYPRSLDTVRDHWQSIRDGFWVGQLVDLVPRYHHLWELAAVGLIAVAGVVAWRRQQRSELGVLGWGAVAYPLTFATIVGVFMVVLGDTGLLLGRYVWVAVVPVVLAMGVALAVLGGPRAGIILVLGFVAVLGWQERTLSHRFLETYYEYDLPGEGLAPVVEQSWTDGHAAAEAILVDVRCPVRVIDLAFVDPPAELVVQSPDGTVTARRTEAIPASFARYWLDVPVEGPLMIPAPSDVAISASEREPAGSLIGAAGDPMLRVHCPADDPGQVRFEQLYDPAHPPVTRSVLFAWPTIWAVGATGAALAAVGWFAWGLAGVRRSAVDDADAVR
ncbi:MAG: glycosyltransferase family 39 protein [Acidimicrobiales bacterium]|nr:glycosyltransferase family 39 protein [Acidimicrobiales bacterium]